MTGTQRFALLWAIGEAESREAKLIADQPMKAYYAKIAQELRTLLTPERPSADACRHVVRAERDCDHGTELPYTSICDACRPQSGCVHARLGMLGHA